jgi:hypothetical protein
MKGSGFVTPCLCRSLQCTKNGKLSARALTEQSISDLIINIPNHATVDSLLTHSGWFRSQAMGYEGVWATGIQARQW